MRDLKQEPDARPDQAPAAAAPGTLLGELEQSLDEALERHAGRLVLLCSFQKEESVLIDSLLERFALSGPGGPLADSVRIVTIDTGVLFSETIATWRRFEEHFGIAIGYEDASAPAGQEPWSGPEHCCTPAKVGAMERALHGADAWITGLRREQGPTRAGIAISEIDGARGIVKYNPLAAWNERDIWRRIHERQIPYHPLHDSGYASIGCSCCTIAGEGRSGRWAGTDKTECGLHLPAAGSPANTSAS